MEGMTLIEIMVVIVIMAMIAVAVGTNVLRAVENAQKKDAVTRARTIQTAALSYRLDHGRSCPTVDELAAEDLLDATTDHSDPWGRPYRIHCDGSAIHVRSAGPDESYDTDDDLGF